MCLYVPVKGINVIDVYEINNKNCGILKAKY